MDIQTRKIKFIQEFLKLQSEEDISKFEKLLKEEQIKEPEEYISPMTIDDLNKRIDRSEDDFKNGRFKTTSELSAKYSL